MDLIPSHSLLGMIAVVPRHACPVLYGFTGLSVHAYNMQNDLGPGKYSPPGIPRTEHSLHSTR